MNSYYYSERRFNYYPFFLDLVFTIIFLLIFSFVIHISFSVQSQSQYIIPIIILFSSLFLIRVFFYTLIYKFLKWKRNKSITKKEALLVIKKLKGKVKIEQLYKDWLKIHLSKKYNKLHKDLLKDIGLSIHDLLSILLELKQDREINFKYDIDTGELLLNEIIQYKPNKKFIKPVKVPRNKKKLFIFKKKALQLDYCIYCGQMKSINAKFCEFCGSCL